MFYRKVVLLAIISFLFECNLYAWDPQDTVKINGGYKECTIYKYFYKSGNVDNQSKRKICTYKYNPEGFILEICNFFDDKLNDRTVNEYDTKSNLVTSICYREDGTISSKTTSKYNAKNKIIENFTENSTNHGKFSNKIIYTYNANDDRVGIITKDGKTGAIVSKRTFAYSYDKNGKLVTKITEPKGKNSEKDIYTYDSKSNLILIIGYDSQGSISYKRTYKYDSKGNVIEEAVSDVEGNLTYHRTYKYDAKGNKIDEIDGVLSTKNSYKYDLNGNLIESIYFEDTKNPNTKQEYVYSK